jgi:hypothetical protein
MKMRNKTSSSSTTTFLRMTMRWVVIITQSSTLTEEMMTVMAMHSGTEVEEVMIMIPIS